MSSFLLSKFRIRYGLLFLFEDRSITKCRVASTWNSREIVFSRREQEERHVQILVPDSRSVLSIQRALPFLPSLSITCRTKNHSVQPRYPRSFYAPSSRGSGLPWKRRKPAPKNPAPVLATRISGAVSVHTFITKFAGNCWKGMKGEKAGKRKSWSAGKKRIGEEKEKSRYLG